MCFVRRRTLLRRRVLVSRTMPQWHLHNCRRQRGLAVLQHVSGWVLLCHSRWAKYFCGVHLRRGILLPARAISLRVSMSSGASLRNWLCGTGTLCTGKISTVFGRNIVVTVPNMSIRICLLYSWYNLARNMPAWALLWNWHERTNCVPFRDLQFLSGRRLQQHLRRLPGWVCLPIRRPFLSGSGV